MLKTSSSKTLNIMNGDRQYSAAVGVVYHHLDPLWLLSEFGTDYNYLDSTQLNAATCPTEATVMP